MVWQRRKALRAKWQWSKKENYKPSKGPSLHMVVYQVTFTYPPCALVHSTNRPRGDSSCPNLHREISSASLSPSSNHRARTSG